MTCDLTERHPRAQSFHPGNDAVAHGIQNHLLVWRRSAANNPRARKVKKIARQGSIRIEAQKVTRRETTQRTGGSPMFAAGRRESAGPGPGGQPATVPGAASF